MISALWHSVYKRARALRDYEEYRGVLPYHATLGEEDFEEDAYLYMLEHADYASFYVGHTGGRPAPKIPRYEFLCSLRDMDRDERREYVRRTVQQIATALATCKFTDDRDHNFLKRLTLVKRLPSVVYRAHEYAKHLGKKLEHEYKSAVVARLSARRNQRFDERDVELRPVGVRRYLQRYIDAQKGLPPHEQGDSDR